MISGWPRNAKSTITKPLPVIAFKAKKFPSVSSSPNLPKYVKFLLDELSIESGKFMVNFTQPNAKQV